MKKHTSFAVDLVTAWTARRTLFFLVCFFLCVGGCVLGHAGMRKHAFSARSASTSALCQDVGTAQAQQKLCACVAKLNEAGAGLSTKT